MRVQKRWAGFSARSHILVFISACHFAPWAFSFTDKNEKHCSPSRAPFFVCKDWFSTPVCATVSSRLDDFQQQPDGTANFVSYRGGERQLLSLAWKHAENLLWQVEVTARVEKLRESTRRGGEISCGACFLSSCLKKKKRKELYAMELKSPWAPARSLSTPLFNFYWIFVKDEVLLMAPRQARLPSPLARK